MTGRAGMFWAGAAFGLSLLSAQAEAEVPVALERAVSFDCTAPGSPLDTMTRAALADKIARKWNLGVAPTEVLQSAVTIRLCLSPERQPDQILLIAAEGPTKAGIDRLFETARRAILRASIDGELPLPEGTNDTWQVLDLVFDANGMTLR